MNKTNNNKIVFGLKMLSVLVFMLVIIPFNKVMAFTRNAPTYISGHYNPDGSYVFGDFAWDDTSSAKSTTREIYNNPVPSIYSIDPKSGNLDINTKTITITGGGFTTNSIARVNDSTRPVTFIDPSHLLVQIDSNDIQAYQNNGGFFITVFNGAPGGGYSNAEFFTIENKIGGFKTSDKNINGDSSDLAASAIFGSTGSFFPSGLIQWILFAIIILLLVILARRVFGATAKYNEAPMKTP